MKNNLFRIPLILLLAVSSTVFGQNNIYVGYKPLLVKYTMVNKIDEDATIMGSTHSYNFGNQLVFGYILSDHFSFETGIGTSKSESSFSFPGIYGTLDPYDGMIYKMGYIDIPAMLTYHTAFRTLALSTGLGLLYKNICKADIYKYEGVSLNKMDFSAEGYETIDRYKRNNLGLVYELGLEFPIAPEKLTLGFSYQYHYIFNDIEDKGQVDKNGLLVWDKPLYYIGTSHGATHLKGSGFAASLIYYLGR